MNISTVTSHSADQVPAPAVVSLSGWVNSPAGPLSVRELGALRAAVGFDFAWPPTATSAIPVAALMVANQHSQELAGHLKVKQLQADDLLKLAAAGLLDAVGVARGVAYLQHTSETADASAVSGGNTTQGDAAATARPTPGTVAADGSVYL
jgi:hypothetical protein